MSGAVPAAACSVLFGDQFKRLGMADDMACCAKRCAQRFGLRFQRGKCRDICHFHIFLVKRCVKSGLALPTDRKRKVGCE